MKAIYFGVIAVLITMLVTGCVQQPADETPEQTQEYQSPADWQSYSGDQFQFRYPQEWLVTVAPGQTALYATVANTDKEVVLGGAAPEDYYLGELTEHQINTEKYAENFTVFKVALYEEQDLSWQQFFAQFYPDVAEFEPYQIEELSGLDAVIVTQLSGLLPGKVNLFVKQGSRFYHFSLYYSSDLEKEAKQNFDNFVLGFNF